MLYQRLKQTVEDAEGQQKTYYMLVSTIENGDNVMVATHPLENDEHLNRAFNLITKDRAEALVKSFYTNLN